VPFRAQAAALAAVLGYALTPASLSPGACWFYSDTSEDFFGEEVSPAIISSPNTYTRVPHGIVDYAEDGENRATTIQLVRLIDKAEWLDEKRFYGGGRDPRLSSLEVAADITEAHLFRISLAAMKKDLPLSPIFRGTSATLEVTGSIAKSGLEPGPFHTNWVSTSGVAPRSGVSLEHGFLLMVLWMLATLDRLNIFGLSAVEHICRRLLQIQKAVKRSPKSPDFSGLDIYMAHLDMSGAIQAPSFDKFIAGEQREANFILKQSRLAREEEEEQHDTGGGGGGRAKKAGKDKKEEGAKKKLDKAAADKAAA
jgi:hypothetical protein